MKCVDLTGVSVAARWLADAIAAKNRFGHLLRNGNTRSCSCLQHDYIKERMRGK
jgi:hypothetical protein